MADAPTVLIVDDDPLVRATFVRILQRGGFQLREAEDGQQGLTEFRRERPDGVLLDLRMPGIDGLDVLSTMVTEAPETPVVVASGAGTMRDAVEALRRGAWDFVTKPMYDPELLVRSLGRAIEKAHLLRQNEQYRLNLERTNDVLARALGELRSDQQGARLLQFQLLPRDGLRLGAHTAYRRIFPSAVLSGDFVDYFLLGERHAGFYVADVSGHGAASAFVTAILTTLVGKYRQALALGGDRTALDPGELLGRLHADLSALPLEKHVTMFYGVLDLEGRRLRYANAGLFPFPFLKERDTAEFLECPGRPLGLPGRGGSISSGERPFPDSARLLVTTDGVLELGPEGPQRQKREDVRLAFEQSEGIDALARRLGLADGASLRDDVAILYVGGSAPGSEAPEGGASGKEGRHG
jgi:sigma-B regulation protein RsbU (phosphoserine phosphatase)